MLNVGALQEGFVLDHIKAGKAMRYLKNLNHKRILKRWMRMSNIYFDNVARIGKLYLEYVFYEFENEPILFLCSDEEKKLYICLCSDIRYGQKWIVVECGMSQRFLPILASRHRNG